MENFISLFTDGSENTLLFNFSILTLTVCYSLYWFASHNNSLLNFLSKTGKSSHQWTVRRLLGFLILGLIPLVLVLLVDLKSLSDLGLNTKWHSNTWIWLSIFIPIIVVMNLLIAKSPANLSQYPQIRDKTWTLFTFIAEYLGWFIYLLGYEFLFRGLLLFGTIPYIGLAPAILLNACIYSLAHMVKGWQETFGALLLGIVLSYLTYLSGSIWFALIFHVSQAWINSYLSFRQQKEMHYASGR